MFYIVTIVLSLFNRGWRELCGMVSWVLYFCAWAWWMLSLIQVSTLLFYPQWSLRSSSSLVRTLLVTSFLYQAHQTHSPILIQNSASLRINCRFNGSPPSHTLESMWSRYLSVFHFASFRNHQNHITHTISVLVILPYCNKIFKTYYFLQIVW